MKEWPSFTVAILSHKRPKLLSRVIGAVSQLDYPMFEIVVVGDQPDIDSYDLPPEVARQIRYRHVAESNISRSRNVALAIAAGDIVAFCDDDAAPEPNWLRALAEAFRRPKVAAAAGTVLTADGITVEWEGRIFNSAGREWPIERPQRGIRIADPYTQTTDNRYLGLIGVNSAFRRIAALQAGGFDEAYIYFLEETDMAIRLARSGWSAALVPGAVVHHLREQNATRTATQIPRDLYQVAASKAHFCRRHMPEKDVAAEISRYREARCRGLDPYIRLGVLRKEGLRKLTNQINRGLREGAERSTNVPLTPSISPPEFSRFHRPGASPPLRIALVSGWGALRTSRIRRMARHLSQAGHIVSLFSYTSGIRPARVTFSDGLWLHRGGTWRANQWTKAGRPIIRRLSRSLAEITRVAEHRNFDVVLRTGAIPEDLQEFATDLSMASKIPDLFAVTVSGEAELPASVRRQLIAALRSGQGPDAERQDNARSPGNEPPVSANASVGYS